MKQDEKMEIHSLRHRDNFEHFPTSRRIPRDKGTITVVQGFPQARCPKCGRITSLRTCYGCLNVMCQECLDEHGGSCITQPPKPEATHDPR